MYKGFIIEDFDENYVSNSTMSFETVFTEGLYPLSESDYLATNDFERGFERFILTSKNLSNDVILDGNKMIETYFPNVNADIFISHSHKDINKAKEFAKEIYRRTGLVSFIDSLAWENVDNLFISTHKDKVPDKYAYMMLNTALLNMIDKCECLFFLNTPNSFNNESNSTFSPWIYSELSMANVIEKKIPKRILKCNQHLIEQSMESMTFSSKNLKITLKPKVDKLSKCKYETIKTWLDCCEKNKKLSNLDELYSAISVKDNRGVL